MPAFRAAGVEQKIVEVPEHEMLVAFGRAQGLLPGSDLEKDFAVEKQRQKLDAWEAVGPAELFDLLRRGERGQRGCDRRIANPEQGAGARRFEDHVVGAPPQIGEAREERACRCHAVAQCAANNPPPAAR